MLRLYIAIRKLHSICWVSTIACGGLQNIVYKVVSIILPHVREAGNPSKSHLSTEVCRRRAVLASNGVYGPCPWRSRRHGALLLLELLLKLGKFLHRNLFLLVQHLGDAFDFLDLQNDKSV